MLYYKNKLREIPTTFNFEDFELEEIVLYVQEGDLTTSILEIQDCKILNGDLIVKSELGEIVIETPSKIIIFDYEDIGGFNQIEFNEEYVIYVVNNKDEDYEVRDGTIAHFTDGWLTLCTVEDKKSYDYVIKNYKANLANYIRKVQ